MPWFPFAAGQHPSYNQGVVGCTSKWRPLRRPVATSGRRSSLSHLRPPAARYERRRYNPSYSSTIVEPPPPLFYGHRINPQSSHIILAVTPIDTAVGYALFWSAAAIWYTGCCGAPSSSIVGEVPRHRRQAIHLHLGYSLPSCTINSHLRELLYPSSSTTHQGTRYLRKPNPEMSKCIYNVIHAYKSRNIWIVCKMYIYLEWNQLTIVFYVYEQHITSCPMITKHHTTMHNTQLDHITKNGSRGSYSQR